MATNRVKSSTNQRKLEDYRAYQEEMLKISREYSQARLAVWTDETRALHDTWNAFTQEWQGNLEQMTALAGSKFDEMAARGEASAGLLAQSWQKNLADVSGAVEQWGANFLQTLGQVAAAWGSTMGSRGGGQEGWSSLLGRGPGFRRLVSPGRDCFGPPGDGDFPGDLDGRRTAHHGPGGRGGPPPGEHGPAGGEKL